MSDQIDQATAQTVEVVRRPNACNCGDCYHPAFGPNTDGDPCDWCRDCGCASAEHRPAGAQDCECVAYVTRTDYGTGVEHDVDRGNCPIHCDDDPEACDA